MKRFIFVAFSDTAWQHLDEAGSILHVERAASVAEAWRDSGVLDEGVRRFVWLQSYGDYELVNLSKSIPSHAHQAYGAMRASIAIMNMAD